MSQPPGNPPQNGDPQGTPAPPAAPAPGWPAPPPSQQAGEHLPTDPTAAPLPPTDPLPPSTPLPAAELPTTEPPAAEPPTAERPAGPPTAEPLAPGRPSADESAPHPQQAAQPAWQPPTGVPGGAPYQPGTPDPSRPGDPVSPGYAGPPPPVKRRGLLITSIVLSIALVLCGAGGTTAYFLVKKVGGSGRATPTAAVEGFLRAVFTDHDVEAANRFVCSESRNKAALSKKIDDLRSYEQKYKTPRYTWPEPTVDSKKSGTATLTVPLTIKTEDDRVATKKLRFVTVNESGWWVCEVSDAS